MIFKDFRLGKRWCGNLILDFMKNNLYRDFLHRNLKIRNLGSINLKIKEIRGKRNYMTLGHNSLIYQSTLRIHGNNNRIVIGDNCKLGKHCKIYVVGNNCELVIGNGCTFNHDVELFIQENNSKIVIGEDCMFSHHINVRTSDSHPIYDIITGKRSNAAKDVLIGNHVWITPECIIHKGCSIGNCSIIGTRSIVTKDIPNNVLAAGIPAKILKQNINWGRTFMT